MKWVYFEFDFSLYYLKSLWIFEKGSFKKLFLYQHSSNHQGLKSEKPLSHSFLFVITISNLLQKIVEWFKTLDFGVYSRPIMYCLCGVESFFTLLNLNFFTYKIVKVNTIS